MNILFRIAQGAIILALPLTAQAAVIDITFDDMANTSFPSNIFEPLVVPQGFQVEGIGPKDIGGLGANKVLNLETVAGGSLRLVSSTGQLFGLLSIDLLVLDPTTQSGYFVYPDSFAITALDELDQPIAQLDVSWRDGTGWRTFTFDNSWSGIATLELGMLDNCCTEISELSVDNVRLSVVPLPAAVWLFLSALAALPILRRKRTGTG